MVFIDGLPTLQEQTAGEVSHQPWPAIELVLPLDPAGEQGEDCLRLRWSIDQEAASAGDQRSAFGSDVVPANAGGLSDKTSVHRPCGTRAVTP